MYKVAYTCVRLHLQYNNGNDYIKYSNLFAGV